MMKKIIILLATSAFALLSFSASANSKLLIESQDRTKTVLGEKLENPYTVENMRAAFNLYNTTSRDSSFSKKLISATHQYIAIHPNSEAHLEALETLDASGLEDIVLHDTPLDYEVISEGDYYVNPKHERDLYHTVYSVIPIGYKLPVGLPYQVLENIYEPADDEEVVEDLALEAVGWDLDEGCSASAKGADLCPSLSEKGLFGGRRYRPSGRVMVLNTDTNLMEPLRWAKISVGRGIWWRYTLTNQDGYFSAPKKYRGTVRIRAKWRSPVATIRKSWNEMLGVQVSDHMMTLTRGSNGKTKYIHASDSRLWYKGTVHNGLIKYNQYASSAGITDHVSGANIWVWENGDDVGVTPMLNRYRNLLELSQLAGLSQNQIWEQIVNSITTFAIGILPGRLQPDIIFSGLKGRNDTGGYVSTREIDQRVFHEAGHYSHAAKAGAWFWANIFTSELTNSIWYGDSYHDGTEPSLSAGKRIGLAEGWANLVELKAMESVHGRAADDYNVWQTDVSLIGEPFDMHTVSMSLNRTTTAGWFLHGLFWDVIDNHVDSGSSYLDGETGVPIANQFGGAIVDNLFISETQELAPVFSLLTSTVTDGCKYGAKLVAAYPVEGPKIEELFHSYGFTCIDGGDGIVPPAAPSGFQVSTQAGGALSINWNTSPGAVTYRIYFKSPSSNTFNFVRQETAPTQSVNTYIPYSTYVKMQACNTAGCGPFTSPRYAHYYTGGGGGDDCLYKADTQSLKVPDVLCPIDPMP